MSLSPASQSNKICATCDYWSGIRQAPKNRTTIYVDKKTPSICLFYKYNIPKKTKSTERCSKWKKWSLL